MRSVITKMATIECSTCSTLLEIFPQEAPGEPNLGWTIRCPHARAEVKRRFAVYDG